MKDVYLSVIIPSYNERENLERGVLSQVKNYLKKQNFSWEVIVSDDDSPDQEAKRLARDFCRSNQGFRFLENKHGGKPLAIWSGIKKAAGEIILFTDMDQSTPIEEWGKLQPYFSQGYGIVIGSRGLERKNTGLFRNIASFVFRNIRKSLLLQDIVDTQAGFKSLRNPIAREIFPLLAAVKGSKQRAIGWTVTSFDVEMLVIAQERGYKIAEVPVSWEDRDESSAKAAERKQGKFVKESIDMFKEVIRVKLNQIKGQYRK